MVADYTRSSEGAIAKTEAKKTCASAQVGASEEYENVPEFSPINTSGILIVASGDRLRQQENARE